jgi:hypothetical protein
VVTLLAVVAADLGAILVALVDWVVVLLDLVQEQLLQVLKQTLAVVVVVLDILLGFLEELVVPVSSSSVTWHKY